MSPSMEEILKSACDLKEIPGVILLAKDKTGIYQFLVSTSPAGPKPPNSHR